MRSVLTTTSPLPLPLSPRRLHHWRALPLPPSLPPQELPQLPLPCLNSPQPRPSHLQPQLQPPLPHPLPELRCSQPLRPLRQPLRCRSHKSGSPPDKSCPPSF